MGDRGEEEKGKESRPSSGQLVDQPPYEADPNLCFIIKPIHSKISPSNAPERPPKLDASGPPPGAHGEDLTTVGLTLSSS